MTELRFPGRWLGGVALVLGPLLMFTGVLLRAGHNFFFPDQLAAYANHPTLMFIAYSLFLAGNVTLWPAVAVLAQRIGVTRPILAVWGGALATFGLFARAFHAGVDHLAFQLVGVQDLPAATHAVADSHHERPVGGDHGGLYRPGSRRLASRGSRPLPGRSAGRMSAPPLGVLKGTTPLSIVAVLGLAVALTPLGIQILRHGQAPRARMCLGWSIAVLAAIAAMAVLGTLG